MDTIINETTTCSSSNNINNTNDIVTTSTTIIENHDYNLIKPTTTIAKNGDDEYNHHQHHKEDSSKTSITTTTTSSTTTTTTHHNQTTKTNRSTNVGKRWVDKIVQIKDILSKYSNPVDFDLTLDSLDEEFIFSHSTNSDTDKFLNTYSIKDLEEYLVKFDILSQLAKRNYSNTQLIPDFSDPFVHRLKMTDQTTQHLKQSDGLLMDIFVRRKDIYIIEILSKQPHYNENHHDNGDSDSSGSRTPLSPPSNNKEIRDQIDNRYLPQFELIGELYPWDILTPTENVLNLINYPMKATIIEWLCLQDPNKQFSNSRPPLPGQYHPGLGIAKQMDLLLVTLANQQGRDCLLNTPFRFYNAFMYQSREYFFIDPAIQAIFLSLLEDVEVSIKTFGLAPVSWAFEFGCVKEKSTQRKVKWEFHKQIRPISKRMKSYFQSKEYTQA
eukprot:gene7510-9230_t